MAKARAPGKRIIAAVNATTPLRESLQAAAELAQLLQAELHILFLLNDDLKQLAELPFTVEIAVRSRDVRQLSPEQIEREQLSRSRHAQSELERILRQTSLRGSFQIISDPVRNSLFKKRKSGDIIWISRDNPLHLPPPGPRLKHTIYLVYQPSRAGEHSLALAERLRALGYRRLVVFSRTESERQAAADQLSGNVEVRLLDDGLPELLSVIENRSSNTLLIPDDAPLALDRDALVKALAGYRVETLIVH